MVRRISTQDLIIDSFEELGSRIPFDKITVQDIADNCSVSRGTFYHHFKDKYEVAAWVYRREARSAFEKGVAASSFRDVQLDLARKAKAKDKLYVNIIENSAGLDSLQRAMKNEAISLITLRLKDGLGVEELDDSLAFTVDYYMHATSDMFLSWIQGAYDLDPEQFSDQLMDCMSPALKNALEAAGMRC